MSADKLRAKKDGRRHNGPAPTPNGEDKQLVGGPHALLEAMRQRARSSGISINEAWRRAAALFLGAKK